MYQEQNPTMFNKMPGQIIKEGYESIHITTPNTDGLFEVYAGFITLFIVAKHKQRIKTK